MTIKNLTPNKYRYTYKPESEQQKLGFRFLVILMILFVIWAYLSASTSDFNTLYSDANYYQDVSSSR